MNSFTRSGAARKPKAYPPVHVVARWVDINPAWLALGVARLEIDAGTGPQLYHVRQFTEGRRVTGYRLVRADDQLKVYDLDASAALSCDCPDAVYRPRVGDGPGSFCKHAVGLRQALAELVGGSASAVA